MNFYHALDGTADVTPLKRVLGAAELGPRAFVCQLPSGKDPDDLTADELKSVKAAAKVCWEEAVDLMVGLVELEIQQNLPEGVRIGDWKEIQRHLARWGREDAALGESIFARYRNFHPELPLDEVNELRAQFGLKAERNAGTEARVTGTPNTPAPMETLKRDDAGNLPQLFNWKWEKRGTKNSKGDIVEKDCRIALDLETVRMDMLKHLGGWPARIMARGAKNPMLFVHQAGDRCVQWIQDGVELETFLKKRFQLMFEVGRDVDGKNFTTPANIYKNLGADTDVLEYKAVEMFPHEPAFSGHYYTCPELFSANVEEGGGGGDGRALFELFCLFENIADDASRTVALAGILTLFWGGPYSQRPIVICEAKHRGSGKTSYVKKISKLVGGYISLALGNPRDETEMLQRLLSPQGREKKCCLWDNVESDRVVKSAWLDRAVTDDELSGKQMFYGEGCRPNNICWFITVNNARLSPDIARRSFRAEFTKPALNEHWEGEINEFIEKNAKAVALDCIAILRAPAPAVNWGKVEETFAPWAREVLGRAHAWLVGHGVIKEGLREILAQNAAWRVDKNDDVQEARFIMNELVQRLAVEREWIEGGVINEFKIARDANRKIVEVQTEAEKVSYECFIGTLKQPGDKHRSMCDYLQDILNRREVNAKWTSNMLNEHIESGRMAGLEAYRRRERRGWIVRGWRMTEYLNAIDDRQKVASQASPA